MLILQDLEYVLLFFNYMYSRFQGHGGFHSDSVDACLVAGINAYCVLTRKVDKYLLTLGTCNRPENFKHLVWTIVPFQVPKYFAEGWPVLAWCFQCLFIFCRTVIAWILHLFDRNMVVTEIAVKNALDILCDIQVVTGTAIMIAGIVQKESLTFYHQQIVINY
jgi:hypothetical protein